MGQFSTSTIFVDHIDPAPPDNYQYIVLVHTMAWSNRRQAIILTNDGLTHACNRHSGLDGLIDKPQFSK